MFVASAAHANDLANPLFNWPGYTGGVTTTNTYVPSAAGWGGGPGAGGATATYDIVPLAPGTLPGNPPRSLRVAWSVAPGPGWSGEGQHLPDFRFTFIENPGLSSADYYSGETVLFSFWGKVATGTYDVVPLMWHSYDANTPGVVGVKGLGYELFESSGTVGVVQVAQGAPTPNAIVTLTDQWQHFELPITLPDTTNINTTPGHYTGWGFDLHTRGAPTIEFALPSMERMNPLPTSTTAVSPFSTAVKTLPGINWYSQYDAVHTKLASCGPGLNCYLNTVGGGGMNPSGGGFNSPALPTVPNESTSAKGAPLVDVDGGPNLSMQSRPTALPNGSGSNLLYATISFRNQPGPQVETTAFYGGAWVKNTSDEHTGLPNYDDLNQVILGRRNFSGNGSGEGIDNVPGQDSWHLFTRDTDSTYGGVGNLSWQMGDGTNLINFESAVDLIDDAWHFVVFNYNGDPTDPDALTMYVDGQRVATNRTVTGSANSLFITSTMNQWLVTVGNSPAKNNIWDGPIDETFLGFGQLSALDVLDLWETATISSQVPGDADGDGDVDLDDFNILSANFYQNVAGGSSDGDFNSDGVVNMDDFTIQSLNFGTGGPDESVSSIPEPATIIILLTSLIPTRRWSR